MRERGRRNECIEEEEEKGLQRLRGQTVDQNEGCKGREMKRATGGRYDGQ